MARERCLSVFAVVIFAMHDADAFDYAIDIHFRHARRHSLLPPLRADIF